MAPVMFTNTNDPTDRVTFRQAFLQGLGRNYGLFTVRPDEIPKLDRKAIEAMSNMSYQQIALRVLAPFIGDDIPRETLDEILTEAYPKSMAPRMERLLLEGERDYTGEPVTDRYIMWLTTGPTYSFKDYAAQFFGKTLDYFLEAEGTRKTVIVATSGDTGGAVAAALHGLANVDMLVLYPAGEVSPGQRRQMTTLGGNIHAIEVKGNFDICQDLAKYLMGDKEFAFQTFGDADHFTSANSISVGRLMPQAVYPFYAVSRIERNGLPLAMSIPSGNFGDMMGTLVAKSMGLPVHKIICALNDNRAFGEYLATHTYVPKETEKSPSTAMNVGHPSNLARVVYHYGGHMFDARDESGKVMQLGVVDKDPDFSRMSRDIFAYSVGEKGHFKAIEKVWNGTRYQRRRNQQSTLLDPHGAVAYRAHEMFDSFQRREKDGQRWQYVIYETADPGKFPDQMRSELGFAPTIPTGMVAQKNMPEYVHKMESEPLALDKTLRLSPDQLAEARSIIRSIYS